MNRRNLAQLSRSSTRAALARQRGFTLLELVLASMLGGAVILAIMGLMSAIRITEVRTRSINRGLVDLNRVHNVATKALSQIVVLPPAKVPKVKLSTLPLNMPPPEPALNSTAPKVLWICASGRALRT